MRSQKQVRRVGKVRSLKNAAAGKWKTYRRHLEARKAWQNNAILTEHQHCRNMLIPPPPKHRRIKEPKQRSPEQLAERQRLREQRRMEKKLAKQRASTSTLPEIIKEKKLKEVLSKGPPEKASAEPKIAAKTTKAKNSMKEIAKRTINVAQQERTAKKVKKSKAIKVPTLENGSKPEHQNLKEERSMSTEKEKRSQSSSSPIKSEQKKLVQSKKSKKQEDILKQIEKQEQDISDKKENKGLNEAMTYLPKDQNCTSESTGMFSSHEIPKDSEILSKAEMIMKGSILEMEMKVTRLAEEHLEPFDAKNLSLSGNVTGNMTTTTYPKETKCVAGVEKKEPVVLVSQTDEVGHFLPTREHICKLLPRDIQFCVHMIEKYGENYEAMAKDQGNISRDSPKGIARKIRIFKESPQYETYLKQKVEKNGSVA